MRPSERRWNEDSEECGDDEDCLDSGSGSWGSSSSTRSK